MIPQANSPARAVACLAVQASQLHYANVQPPFAAACPTVLGYHTSRWYRPLSASCLRRVSACVPLHPACRRMSSTSARCTSRAMCLASPQTYTNPPRSSSAHTSSAYGQGRCRSQGVGIISAGQRTMSSSHRMAGQSRSRAHIQRQHSLKPKGMTSKLQTNSAACTRQQLCTPP